MKKTYIIIGVVVLLGAFLAYFFLAGLGSRDLSGKRNSLQQSLTQAKNELNKARKNFSNLLADFNKSFSLSVSVQEEMKRVSDITKETDFMFNNPNTLNPEFKISTVPNNTDLNDSRREVNVLLVEWKAKTAILYASRLDLKETAKISNDIQTIADYLQDLYETMYGLTPENSGLSQDEINAYLVQLPNIDTVNSTVASLQNSINNLNESLASDSSPSSDTSTVLSEDLASQQENIEDIENQINSLEDQLAEVEQEIQGSVDATEGTSTENQVTDPEPEVVDTTTTPVPENTVTTESTSSSPTGPRNFVPTQGIIIQPGPAKMIQGTDPF